jgi:hypothetical protein
MNLIIEPEKRNEDDLRWKKQTREYKNEQGLASFKGHFTEDIPHQDPEKNGDKGCRKSHQE